jgi:nitrous oxide reductase accessory protein NosL
MKCTKSHVALICVCLFFLITATVILAGASETSACGCCPTGKQSSAPAAASGTIEGEASCSYCGMDRSKFAHSRMLIEFEDGTKQSTCSIRCLVVELANSIDKSPKAIRVGDFNSRKLIDAESAFWIIGGNKAGVMSSRAKWAFEKKSEAEAFIAANGGSQANFEEALKAAYEDLYKDTRMIREKRKLKRMKQPEQK